MEYEIKVRCTVWASDGDSKSSIEKDLKMVSKYTRQFAQVLVNGMQLYRCGYEKAGDMLKELIDKEYETAQEYGKMYEELRG
jgi:hypothetical protein